MAFYALHVAPVPILRLLSHVALHLIRQTGHHLRVPRLLALGIHPFRRLLRLVFGRVFTALHQRLHHVLLRPTAPCFCLVAA